MALSPFPVVVADSGTSLDAPDGSVPIALYGAGGGTPEPIDPIVQALIDAGFGEPGEVLATNDEGDGFEWVELPDLDNNNE